MSAGSAKDGFIAVRKGDVAAALADVGGVGDLYKILSAILHFEAHSKLDALKALYDPLDADAPAARRDSTLPAFEAFERAFADVLARGNFREVDAQTIQTIDATKLLTGLNIKPQAAGIRRIHYFVRGARTEKAEVKTWLGLRRKTIDVEIFSDVVVLVGFKSSDEIDKHDRRAFARMRRGVRPGAVIVKYFRNVAHAELVTLHPGARPAMRPRDQAMLAVPALAGGIPVLANLWPALTVLLAVLAAYWGAGQAIDNDRLTHAVGALGGLFALGAFVMRQRMKFETTSLRYQKRLSETIYFRNLANNAGALDYLIGAGEEQDVKEALIAYGALAHAATPLSRDQLDAAVEAFLRERFQLDVDFEIADALAKIERLGLVQRDGETYRAMPAREALALLDATWADFFKFEAQAA